MGISRAADLYYTYRFLKILVTDWKDMDAYNEGIIDDKGKNLIKTKDLLSIAQKEAFTTFHRLVFNIKRILEKVPFGSSRIKSYAAALYLLREETGMSEEQLNRALDELGVDIAPDLNEDNHNLLPGDYILNETLTDRMVKGSVISLSNTIPAGSFSGIDIYKSTTGILFTAYNVK